MSTLLYEFRTMKTCKDFAYTGVDCCQGCHYEADDPELRSMLITIPIDGEPAYVCCELADFFYPDGLWKTKDTTGQWKPESSE